MAIQAGEHGVLIYGRGLSKPVEVPDQPAQSIGRSSIDHVAAVSNVAQLSDLAFPAAPPSPLPIPFPNIAHVDPPDIPVLLAVFERTEVDLVGTTSWIDHWGV